ncbi:MAG: trypsin-like peptidase domain-containing protein [Gemmataceae bacterium]
MLLLLFFATGILPPARLEAGCVLIRAENDGSGAGFVVDAKKKWIITCRHVVADRDRVDVYFPWTREGSLVAEKSEYLGNRPLLRERGLLATARVLKKSDDADLALLEVESLPASATAVSLAAAPPQPGDALRALGHRIDLDTVFNLTTGFTRQSGRLANGYFWRGKKLAVNADTILGQLPIEEGDSGGPVFNAKAELVGMVSALRRQAPLAAVAISAAEIRKFLAVTEPAAKPAAPGIADILTRATVWIRPQSADIHLAGALVSRDHVLTSARGLGPSNLVGVAFPLNENGKWIGEREPYRDPIGLHQKNAWSRGVVIARDPVRDLALISLDEGTRPSAMRPAPLAAAVNVSEAVHAMSHPGGVEFAWVYASGSVRQVGRIALAQGEKPAKVNATLLQLPAQSGSPGGPVLNERGELVGVLAARESAQNTGYAATPDEIADFLDVALADRPAKSVAALLNRIETTWERFSSDFAGALAYRGLEYPAEKREAIFRLAHSINPRSFPPQVQLWNLLMRAGRIAEAEAVLDRAIENDGPDQAAWLGSRAVRRMDRKEWRGARGDLERILDVYPRQASARRSLVGVLLELNKDEEAAAAVGDTVRSQPDGIRFLAADLLRQADELAKKFPDAPAIPSNWLNRAIGAAAKSETDAARKAECEVVLKAVAAAPDDGVRLRLLREYLAKLKPAPDR